MGPHLPNFIIFSLMERGELMGEIYLRKGKIEASRCMRLMRAFSSQSQHLWTLDRGALGAGGRLLFPTARWHQPRACCAHKDFNRSSWHQWINQRQLLRSHYKWILDLRYHQMGRPGYSLVMRLQGCKNGAISGVAGWHFRRWLHAQFNHTAIHVLLAPQP